MCQMKQAAKKHAMHTKNKKKHEKKVVYFYVPSLIIS